MTRLQTLALAALVLCSCGGPQSDDDATGEESSALYAVLCPGPNTLRGLDVSSYQHQIDWAQVKQAGIKFAYARVALGTTADTQFANNWHGLEAQGLSRGVYQYFYPADDALAQANLLLSKLHAAGGLRATDLPPALDMEYPYRTVNGVKTLMSVSDVQAQMNIWLERITQATGRLPIIYTRASGLSPFFAGGSYGQYPLWVASWTHCAYMPPEWSRFNFWQDHGGAVPGIDTSSDMDLFNGTSAELATFVSSTVLQQPSFGTCASGTVYNPASGWCDPPASCTGSGQGSCSWGQYCHATHCAERPRTCSNFEHGVHFDPRTSSGPIIYAISLDSTPELDRNRCPVPGLHHKIGVKVRAYAHGAFPANERALSTTGGPFELHAVGPTGLEHHQPVLDYVPQSDEATVVLHYCVGPGSGTLPVGLYFTGGNEACATVAY